MRRLVFLLVALGFAVAAASASSTTASTPLSPKLRGDLAALVAGEATLDARMPDLIPGLEAGEIPFFAVLSEPNDLAHRAQLEGLGARVLRTYRSVDAFALVSDAGTVSEVAALPWVDWLAPPPPERSPSTRLVSSTSSDAARDKTRPAAQRRRRPSSRSRARDAVGT